MLDTFTGLVVARAVGLRADISPFGTMATLVEIGSIEVRGRSPKALIGDVKPTATPR